MNKEIQFSFPMAGPHLLAEYHHRYVGCIPLLGPPASHHPLSPAPPVRAFASNPVGPSLLLPAARTFLGAPCLPLLDKRMRTMLYPDRCGPHATRPAKASPHAPRLPRSRAIGHAPRCHPKHRVPAHCLDQPCVT
jgi:hypothetical protein